MSKEKGRSDSHSSDSEPFPAAGEVPEEEVPEEETGTDNDISPSSHAPLTLPGRIGTPPVWLLLRRVPGKAGPPGVNK
ncbi:hypothetical protein GCM10017708_29530 [Arthrobacter citreus]